MKKKNLNILALSVIGILLLSLVGFFAVQETTFSDDIYSAQFGNMKCDKIGIVQSKSFPLTTSVQTFICGDSSGINGDMKDGCDVYGLSPNIVTRNSQIALCPQNVNNIDDGSCRQVGGAFLDLQKNIPVKLGNIPNGWKVIAKGKAVLGLFFNTGDIVIELKGQPYGIIAETGSNFLSLTANCNVASLGYDYKITSNVGTSLQTNTAYNYVHFLSRISPSPLDLKTISGKQVYVFSQNGCYYNILEIDGRKYTDSSNANGVCGYFKCQPSLPYCADDGMSIIPSPEGKSCGIVGSTVGYYPISSTQECLQDCVSGKIVNTKCRAIVNCPPDKPFKDGITGECKSNSILTDNCPTGQHTQVANSQDCSFFCQVGITEPKVTTTTQCVKDVDYIFISIIFAIAIVLMFLIYMAVGKQKGVKKK